MGKNMINDGQNVGISMGYSRTNEGQIKYRMYKNMVKNKMKDRMLKGTVA